MENFRNVRCQEDKVRTILVLLRILAAYGSLHGGEVVLRAQVIRLTIGSCSHSTVFRERLPLLL